MPALGVAVHGLRRERRQANRDVLGPLSHRRAVLNPLTSAGNDRLARVHLDYAGLMRDAQLAAQHYRVFVKLGSLSRFDPAAWTAHVSDTHSIIAGVHPADMFVNDV